MVIMRAPRVAHLQRISSPVDGRHAIDTIISAATIGVGLCLAASVVAAQERPAEGTVLIRVVGHVTAVLSDETGAPRRQVEFSDVEIGTGSGMIVSRFGYVLTNHHVIAGGELRGRIEGVPATMTLTVQRVEVRLPPERRSDSPLARFDASIVADDPELDLAVLTIPGNDFPYVPFGDSDALQAGQAVSVIGYPLGEALEVGRAAADESTSPAMATGIVSALREDGQGNLRYIQTSAPLNRGNSGGPLLDRAGFAAGIVRMKATAAEGIAFAIPINLVKDFLARYGLDAFLPATRLARGHLYDAPDKLIRFLAPIGFDDAGRSRLGVDSGSSLTGVSLRIDRVAATWRLEQLEEELRSGRSFERYPSTQSAPPTREERVLRGQATGRADGRPFRMLYSVVDLGGERIVARYIGSAEQVAFNESVLAASLASIEAAPMISASTTSAGEAQWIPVSPPNGPPVVTVIPGGWILDAGAPVPCGGVTAPRASLVASPLHDFTLSFRVGQLDGTVDPRQAAARCAGDSGSSTDQEYRYRFSRFGVDYTVEGRFLVSDSKVLQFEVVAPTRTFTGARDLWSRWIAELLKPRAVAAR